MVKDCQRTNTLAPASEQPTPIRDGVRHDSHTKPHAPLLLAVWLGVGRVHVEGSQSWRLLASHAGQRCFCRRHASRAVQQPALSNAVVWQSRRGQAEGAVTASHGTHAADTGNAISHSTCRRGSWTAMRWQAAVRAWKGSEQPSARAEDARPERRHCDFITARPRLCHHLARPILLQMHPLPARHSVPAPTANCPRCGAVQRPPAACWPAPPRTRASLLSTPARPQHAPSAAR